MNAEEFFRDWQRLVGSPDDDGYYREVWEKVLGPLSAMARECRTGFIPCPGNPNTNLGGFFWGKLLEEQEFAPLRRLVTELSGGKLRMEMVTDIPGAGIKLEKSS